MSKVTKLLMVCCVLSGILFHFNFVFAEIIPDIPIDPNSPPMSPLGGESTASLDYPNAAILVYQAGDDSIVSAMSNMGATNVRYRDNATPVTQADWQWCDIFVLASNSGSPSNLAGLDTDDVENNIAGRVVLSGHDADLHVTTGHPARTFVIQAINYVMAGSGKGAVALGDSGIGFDWTPASWGIESNANYTGEEITSITTDGLTTGIYDNLTKEDMSNWSVAFHVYFTSYGLGFKPYEIGKFNGIERVVTIGCSINPMGVILEKEDGLIDDVECAAPENEVAYEICYENTTDRTFYDCFLVDLLPPEMDYPAGIGTYVFDGNSISYAAGDLGYNEEDHYYVWNVGTIAPNDANCVSLDVVMNYKAAPGTKVHNLAQLWGTVYDANGLNPTEILIASTTEDTLVCCWSDDPNLIYVDQTATGLNNGTNWYDAYTDLADALVRAAESKCTDAVDIYVAQGTYDPNNAPGYTFVLPDGCSMYGGFKSGGCDFGERNPKRYETILTGLIDDDAFPDADTVVTMGDETLLDGFTVTNAFEQTVYGNGANFTLSHCTIQGSFGHGIYALNGDVDVQWCTIKLNDADGIRHEGAEHTLSVNNSWILRNGECGINCEDSTPMVKNCIVSESDLTRQGRAGIRLYRPAYSPVLHNLTVSNNKAEGIFFTDDGDISGDPNNKDWPDLQNSIVYYNNPTGGNQLAGLNPDMVANFCCIQDCNEPGTTNYNSEPGFAYVVDPNGAPDPNNYHLAYDAFCIDKANPYLSYTNQVDIDGEGFDRKYGDYVDIGADEVYDCGDDYLSDIDVHNDLDFNADGLVNLEEFAGFSAVWLCRDPNDPSIITDPNYSSDPDYADPNMLANWEATWPQATKYNFDDTGDSEYMIDLADLDVFLDNWLWVACWKLGEIEQTITMSGGSETMLMMQPLSMMTMEIQTIESEPESSLDTLVQIVGFLDEVAAETSDNIENIWELRAYLMDEIWAIWNRENE